MSKIFKILVILFLVPLLVQAQDDLPAPMSPPRLVNDFAGIYSTTQNQRLESALRAYDDSTSTQIYIVIVNDLKGYAVSDFATRLGEKWGIGQKDKNNGVLILIKPRIGNEGGQVFITTGYGVEHILTDARCGRIIDEYMMPYLQNGDYYNATRSAIDVIIKYLSGEFKGDEDNSGSSLIGNIVLVIIVLLILYISYKNNKGGPSSGGHWRRTPGGFGGWGGSSSSGGGFRGGGGGSFGGGGAGRSF